MRPAFLLFLVAFAAACTTTTTANQGGGSGDDGSGNGSGSGDDGSGNTPGTTPPKPRKVCTGFASGSSSWAVPDDSFDAVNALYGEWLTMDLDGDGKLDLVRAADPANNGHSYKSGSQAYWQYFKGTDAGFATSPAQWNVPDDTFDAVDALYGEWLTMDLDGDGKLDLVRAADPANNGHSYKNGAQAVWQFFKGGASGFASSPSMWSVPDDSFDAVRALYGEWVTMDLDGDGKLDLVRAADPANNGHSYKNGAQAVWQFFKGGASGFASSPSTWSVPEDSFDAVNALYGEWLTMDLDGDGKLDLVRAADPANNGHSYKNGAQAVWQFFKGGASGFASSPSTWNVPDDSFDAVRALYGEWVTMDLDDDGRLDLVRAADPANNGHSFLSGTQAYWQFWKGTASGFAPAPSQWNVPDSAFDAVNALYGEWLTMDLDGDGCVDLVRAADPSNTGHAFPGPSWQRFAAQ